MFVIAGRRAVAVAALPPRLHKESVVVRSVKDLKSEALPVERLLAVWNNLPGVKKLDGFKDQETAIRRVWAGLKKLPAPPRGENRPVGKKAKPDTAAGRADSKQAQVIAMLRGSKGATIDALVEATGWQPHSVRGLISGALKKRLGLKVKASDSSAGQRVYRIVA
jgi:hypothetical protein